MSDPSPYSSQPAPQPPVDREAALRRVKAPAIGLIVIGVISAVSLVGSAAMSLLVDVAAMQGQQAAMLEQYGLGFLASQAFTIGSTAAGVVASVVMILGGLKMRALEGWGLALTASILTFLPGLTCCCVITLPFGLWALIVLVDADVKQAFR
jgi:hypothetical protein